MLENLFWSWVLKDCIKVQEEKKKVVVLCSWCPRQNVNLGTFTLQRRQRNVQKSVMHVQTCYFANLNLLLFLPSRSRRRRLQKRPLKSEFALLQTLSRLFQLVQFVKCWQIFLELNSKRLYQRSGKEKESRCPLFMSSTKREIRNFHVVVVQWRQRNVQKSVMHVQSCCFASLNLLLFCRSLCCRRRRCLRSLLLTRPGNAVMFATYVSIFFAALKTLLIH